MTWAYVQNSTASQERHNPPTEGTRQDTGQSVSGMKPSDTALLAACGWKPVTANARPADTASNTSDRSLVVTAGVPVETWTVRPFIQAELDANTANANKSSIQINLEQDQVVMQTIVDTAANSIVVTTLPQAQQAARDALQRDKDIARNLKRLNRIALQDFDGTA